jgi:hypothetical protein
MAANAHSMTASLPSDYAVVSRYAAAHPGTELQNTDSTDAEQGTSDLHITKRPSHPSLGVSSRPQLTNNATETTPLLSAQPQVPRIEERHPADTELSTAAIYLSELRILTKYS